MSRADKLALLLSLIAVLAAYFVADRVFERFAHTEDEITFVWEAQAIARGTLTVPSPPQPKRFLVPFVVDHEGLRFGKYPIGWPALLSYGVRLGVRDWVNPLMAGLAVWFTYRLGKRLLGETVGLLAAGLTILSPFFLMLSGSLFSHPFGLALSAAFALVWLDNFGERPASPRWLPTITLGLLLGVLLLARPLTAAGIALPFILHGLYLFLRGGRAARLHLLVIAAFGLFFVLLHFAWQSAVTGEAFLNPYTLWWEYDKVGFGPDFGRSGHTLHKALGSLAANLRAGVSDLFGWPLLSWLFLPFGLWAIRRERRAWLVAGVFPSLMLVYLAYWVGSWLLGPRYYYEGLYSLTLLTAAGIAWLAGWPLAAGEAQPIFTGRRKLRPLLVTALLALLVAGDLFFYIPTRVGGAHGLYDMERAELAPFETAEAQQLAPALILVHAGYWTDYGVFIELENPFLDTPFIFATSGSVAANAELAEYFASLGRSVYHYYPDEPGRFYPTPRPAP